MTSAETTRQRKGLTPVMWGVVKDDDRPSVAVCVKEIEVLHEALRYIRAEATERKSMSRALMAIGLDNIILECEGVLPDA